MAHQVPKARFSLGTFSSGDQAPYAGLCIEGDRVIPVAALGPLLSEAGHDDLGPLSVLNLIDHWSTSYTALQAAAVSLSVSSGAAAREATASLVPMKSLRVHPPVMPRQIFLCGANYFKHVVDFIVDSGPGKTPGTDGMSPAELRAYAEALMTRRRAEGAPYIFMKPVSAVSGAFDAVVIPSDAKQLDWEVELAVVIGHSARRVNRADARSYIAGYTIVNDLTSRGQLWTQGDMKAMGTDWLTAKGRPTYLPCGPTIVPAAFVPEPQNLRITLKLNGDTKQDDSTEDMIFDVARLVEHVSGLVQLQPGDLICTGSPAGNGSHFNRYLQPGDVMTAAITGLGEQRTPVIAERN